MGCINSKNELDIHPNIYRVVNVDEEGYRRWSGQLEIAPRELTLYRKGKEPTKWSLQHLRRYGFDADLFTFEAGRRCTTGEGIYAFRCRRAESLFHLLQTYINQGLTNDIDGTVQNSNDMLNSMSGRVPVRPLGLLSDHNPNDDYVIPSNVIGSTNNVTNTSHVEGNYMEPNPIDAQNIRNSLGGTRLNSFESSNGPVSTDEMGELNSPGSPNSFNMILEVTQLNEAHHGHHHLSSSHYQNSNVYQEFPLRSATENNNNINNKNRMNPISNNNNINMLSKKLSLDIPPQEPAPSVTMTNATSCNSILSSSSRISGITRTFHDKPLSCCSQVITNSNELITSPTSLAPSIPTAANPTSIIDSMESKSHMYVNVTPGEIDGICDPALRCYENLEPSEMRAIISNNSSIINANAAPTCRTLHQRYSKPDIFANVELPPAEKSEPSTPTANLSGAPSLTLSGCSTTPKKDAKSDVKVNYIVLDLDPPAPNNTVSTANTAGNNTTSITANNSSTVITTQHASATRINSTHKMMESVTSPTAKGNLNNATSVITNKDTKLIISSSRSGSGISNLLSPDSPKKNSMSGLGYATIDFNKTVALSNSIVPVDENCEGSRRTRHSNPARHSNSISD
ncbi:mucin-2 isoform X2 [Condylostylus longicornis]|uniref:mucin-2 isoform X2 n=1 Tax=Condylostylus longicornis TaxID=2530218 RepID=UPI00244D9BC1|nr:mucin-2 isoform X2 [Condylostylus longicornis]